ncbi:MAG: hypothetical protein ABSG38_16105 [Spirochaetia bacterium]|jgi:hypothetical protein
MDAEKAKRILEDNEAGTRYEPALLDLAREALGLPTEGKGTMNEKFAAQIVGVDISGKDIPLAACLAAGSWAGVKVFTPFGLRMQELIVDFRASSDAAAGSETGIVLGSTSEGREVTLGDVEREGIGLFSGLAKYTEVGASARDMLAELEVERLAKAAGLGRMPDLPGLRMAIEKGRKDWTGSPWPYTTEQGMAGEIANQATVLTDRAHTAPGVKGLPVFPKGPGKLAKEAPADLLARAKALKIDIAIVEGGALAAKMDPIEALKAEVFNQELLVSDRARSAMDGVIS